MSRAVTLDTDKPIGPRSSKGERTKAKLLQAAKEVFEEDGFLEARISDIAERAGLSYGSFYHYFPSKEEIFREVAAVHERQLGAAVVAETALVDPADDAPVAARFEAANRRFLAEYRREARLMRVIEQVSRYDPTLNTARLDRHQAYAQRLADAIRGLQRDGEADPGIDPTIGSQVLMAMVTRFAEAWFVQGRIDCTLDQGVEQLNRLCRNALRVRGGRPAGAAAAR